MNNEREQQMMGEAEVYVLSVMDHVYSGAEFAKAINDFCAGWRAADKHPQWIPVEERLPEPHFADTSSNWVLVCTTKGGIFIDSYNHKHNEWCNNRTSVTHWMSMPPAPRKERNNEQG
jgi:hypothetical protein